MRLAIPDYISNSYFPVIAAVELDLFRQQGLDIELELVFPVTRAMQALQAGDYDFVAGSASATLTGFPEWTGAKLLAALAQHTYWFLVMRSELQPTRGDLEIVRGRRIGAAPGVDVSLKRLLKEVGIDPEKDVHIGPVPGTASNLSFGVTAAQALEDGQLDGFWANGMGAEVAVRSGSGTIVLDVRRGDGPPPARHYTFPALVTRDDVIARQPEAVEAAIKGLMAAQRALRADSSLATEVGERVFPQMEASMIAQLVERDAPYYQPAISATTVERLQQFAQDMGLLATPAPYEHVVALQFAHLWAAAG